MSLLQAVIYGIIQGLGEFLPISSTAHLALMPKIFGWEDPGLAFDVALHMGTLAAVAIYFWKDWLRLVKAGLTDAKSADAKLFRNIVLACVPGGVLGLLFEGQIETTFRNPMIIGIMLMIMGLVLYAADRYCGSETPLEGIGAGKSLIIGVSQALAMIPGVSRSGITMAAGRALNIKREDAARFTFLLSTPFIFFSGVYKAKDIFSDKADIAPVIVAVAVSAAVGAISIKFLLGYLKHKGFGVFAVYRLVAGGAIVLWQLLSGS